MTKLKNILCKSTARQIFDNGTVSPVHPKRINFYDTWALVNMLENRNCKVVAMTSQVQKFGDEIYSAVTYNIGKVNLVYPEDQYLKWILKFAGLARDFVPIYWLGTTRNANAQQIGFIRVGVQKNGLG